MHREGKSVTKGHTASEWQRQDVSPGTCPYLLFHSSFPFLHTNCFPFRFSFISWFLSTHFYPFLLSIVFLELLCGTFLTHNFYPLHGIIFLGFSIQPFFDCYHPYFSYSWSIFAQTLALLLLLLLFQCRGYNSWSADFVRKNNLGSGS